MKDKFQEYENSGEKMEETNIDEISALLSKIFP